MNFLRLRHFSTWRQGTADGGKAVAFLNHPPKLASFEQENPKELPRPNNHSFTVNTLMEARVHIGHKANQWDPRMRPFILGERNGIHIIDLDQTILLLRRALRFIKIISAQSGNILWFSSRQTGHARIAQHMANLAGASYYDGRWVPGTFTNPIFSGEGAKSNYAMPHCIFILDVKKNNSTIAEAKRVGIPIVAIIDTDCNPRLVDYPIPGNDENILAIHLYCQLVKNAMLEGAEIAIKKPYLYKDFEAEKRLILEKVKEKERIAREKEEAQ